MPDFETALQIFYQGCIRVSDQYRRSNFPNLDPEKWDMVELRKRYRISRNGGAHAFVDKETGDVLKPATWDRPAKHARGNIFDEHNGLSRMGPYGPAYLR